MRKFKKFLCAALASTMVLAMAAPSFAAKGDPGTITIENASKGQVYTAYKLFEANPSGTLNGSISYTATRYQKTEIENYAANHTGLKAPFAFQATADSETWTVLPAENVSDEEVSAFVNALFDDYRNDLNMFESKGTGQLPESAKAEDELTLELSEYGYYFVTTATGATVSVTSNNPYVSIYDKNQSVPTWEGDGKTILLPFSLPEGAVVEDNGTYTDDEGNVYNVVTIGNNNYRQVTQNSVNYGEPVLFQLEINTTNHAKEDEIEKFTITDSLGKGLQYVLDADHPFMVMVGGTSINEYTGAPTSADRGFTLDIPWVDKNGNDIVRDAFGNAQFKYPSPSKIIVRYYAELSDSADVNTPIKNTANFTYNNETIPSNNKETETKTYAMAIYKINDEGTGLSGAKFNLNLVNGTESIQIPVTGTNGVYTYDSSTEGTKNYELESPSEGIIIIKGLKEGTYTLTETEAPAGYNRLEAAVSNILVNGDNGTNVNEIILYTNGTDNKVVDAQKNLLTKGTPKPSVSLTVSAKAVSVVNYSGSVLPSTGGIGTTIFYAVGIILMAGAVFFVVRRKKA